MAHKKKTHRNGFFIWRETVPSIFQKRAWPFLGGGCHNFVILSIGYNISPRFAVRKTSKNPNGPRNPNYSRLPPSSRTNRPEIDPHDMVMWLTAPSAQSSRQGAISSCNTGIGRAFGCTNLPDAPWNNRSGHLRCYCHAEFGESQGEKSENPTMPAEVSHPNPPSNLDIFVKSDGLGIFLFTGKASDARRRGATIEAYVQYAAKRSERRQHSR
jgi:hypothetical protein